MDSEKLGLSEETRKMIKELGGDDSVIEVICQCEKQTGGNMLNNYIEALRKGFKVRQYGFSGIQVGRVENDEGYAIEGNQVFEQFSSDQYISYYLGINVLRDESIEDLGWDYILEISDESITPIDGIASYGKTGTLKKILEKYPNYCPKYYGEYMMEVAESFGIDYVGGNEWSSIDEWTLYDGIIRSGNIDKFKKVLGFNSNYKVYSGMIDPEFRYHEKETKMSNLMFHDELFEIITPEFIAQYLDNEQLQTFFNRTLKQIIEKNKDINVIDIERLKEKVVEMKQEKQENNSSKTHSLEEVAQAISGRKVSDINHVATEISKISEEQREPLKKDNGEQIS